MTSTGTPGFAVVPAAYVVPLRDGPAGTEVLLQLRQGTDYMDGHWGAAAAGHVEVGETAYDAAAREALEEIGVAAVRLEFLTTMQRTAAASPIDERVDFFFTTRSWSGEPRILEPDRCGDLRWWPLDRLPDPVVPHERQVLEQIASGRVTAYQTFGFTPTGPAGSEAERAPR